MPYPARKIAVTPSRSTLRTRAAGPGRRSRAGAKGLRLLACLLPEAFELPPEDPAEDDDEEGCAPRKGGETGMVEEIELKLERPGHREEEVEVDEGAGDREEDLLDDHAAEDAREGGTGDHRDEHQQHHHGAEVRREEAVQRHAGGVGGEHLEVRERRGKPARRMKYQATAVSVVWTVCTAQPAIKYWAEMSVRASQTLLSQPRTSTPSACRRATTMTPTNHADLDQASPPRRIPERRDSPVLSDSRSATVASPLTVP